MCSHGDRRGQIADLRDSFERIDWLYLLFKCGIKTKTHFKWLLWHWSSLSQLNKVPTDLVKISVKEAMHMGFCYRVTYECDSADVADAYVKAKMSLTGKLNNVSSVSLTPVESLTPSHRYVSEKIWSSSLLRTLKRSQRMKYRRYFRWQRSDVMRGSNVGRIIAIVWNRTCRLHSSTLTSDRWVWQTKYS